MPRLSAHNQRGRRQEAEGGDIVQSASSLQSSAFKSELGTRNSKIDFIDRLIQTILLLAVGLTPLIFSQRSTELFEFPKMAFVYILSLAATWLLIIKWWQQKHITFISTPLNRPIAIFLLWLLITGITGLHFYTSIAGYYTRFNGGLASYIAYAILFYALVDQLAGSKAARQQGRNNLLKTQVAAGASYADFLMPKNIEIMSSEKTPIEIQKNEVQSKSENRNQKSFTFRISNLFRISNFKIQKGRILNQVQDDDKTANRKPQAASFLTQLLWSWLLGASIVSVWGILEHFGHDPSCIILRGTFTANCWVEDVQARVFSTFGQPNWLATYLVATIPLGLALNLISTSKFAKWLTAVVTILCYAAFWYTYSRSGWFGLIAALIILAMAIPWKTVFEQKFWIGGIVLACLVISLTSFSGAKLRAETALSGRGDDSSTGSIRLLVWQGTLGIIKDHPLLGTGPETFAYIFPAYRPVAANTTTEWNFLYNEAHNQALNTAATIGIPGLLIWLSLFAIPFWFLWQANTFVNLDWLKRKPATGVSSVGLTISSTSEPRIPRDGNRQENPKIENRNKPESQNKNNFIFQISNMFRISRFGFQKGQIPDQARDDEMEQTAFILNPPSSILLASLAAGIIGVFISQLFGFAVVVTNLLLFVSLAIIIAPWAQKLERGQKTEEPAAEASSGGLTVSATPELRAPRDGLISTISQSSILHLPSNRSRVSNFVSLALALILLPTSYFLFNYISAELLIKQADTEISSDPGQAIYDYQTAINRNPFEPNYRLQLAAAQINSATTNARDQFYSQADQQLQIARQLNPHDLIIAKSTAYFYRTMASVDSNYKSKALQTAQNSVDLAPTDADAVKTLADTQKDLGSPNNALKNYNKLVQLRPTVDSYLARATYYHQFGPTDKFHQDIQTVLQMDPNNQEAKQMLQE